MQRTAPPGELAQVRAVLAFAKATQAPPEATAWLLRMLQEAEDRRAEQAREVLAPLLVPSAAEKVAA